MGKLIDITERIEAKRLALRGTIGPIPDSPPALTLCEEEALEIAEDLFSDFAFVQEPDICQTCGQRRAVADVYRSDADGLGGRLYCQRCLVAELRHNRLTPRCGKVDWLVAEALVGRDDAPIRVEVTWDTVRERALRFDGILLS